MSQRSVKKWFIFVFIWSSDVFFLSGANQQIGTHQNLQAFNLENMMIEGVKVIKYFNQVNNKCKDSGDNNLWLFQGTFRVFLVFGRQNRPKTRQHKQCIIQLYCTIYRYLYWSISFPYYFILAFHCMLEENIIVLTPWSLQFYFADCSCITAENGCF